MLETGGAKEVKIDYAAKTATFQVPAAVTDEMATKAVSGRFTAKVHQ